jgi:hypothetical protein
MKLEKGNYPGASALLRFDEPLETMTREQMIEILTKLLQYANPHSGLAERDTLRQTLADAEETMKENCGN